MLEHIGIEAHWCTKQQQVLGGYSDKLHNTCSRTPIGIHKFDLPAGYWRLFGVYAGFSPGCVSAGGIPDPQPKSFYSTEALDTQTVSPNTTGQCCPRDYIYHTTCDVGRLFGFYAGFSPTCKCGGHSRPTTTSFLFN